VEGLRNGHAQPRLDREQVASVFPPSCLTGAPMRSVCGPFRPPLRSSCGPDPREHPRTGANSAHEAEHLAGIRGSPVLKEYRGDRLRLAFQSRSCPFCGPFAVLQTILIQAA
jgi:hypothetical protein